MRGVVVIVVALLLIVACSATEITDPVPKGVIAGSGNTVGYGELKEEWRGEVVQLSWSPRAFLLKGFLDDEECEYLKNLARSKMRVSTVADNKTGRSKPSTVRTSTGMFMKRGENEVVRAIERRVAQVTMMPIEHQEGLQILHYIDGQKYEPHFDYFHDESNSRSELGGQRILTILMYMSTPTKGGETVFPAADTKVTGPNWSDCAKQGFGVKPYKGDALFFYSLHPDGTKDASSLHGSCPIERGEKWSATKWVHVLPFGHRSGSHDYHDCLDFDPQCAAKASNNQCSEKQEYMMRFCRKTCSFCGHASQ